MNSDIRAYVTTIPESAIEDLHRRLDNTRWPEAEPVDDWSQGIPLSYVQELVKYWRHDYDWRRWENQLNNWDQFVTTIDDLEIHFLHVRSPHENALPLLMTHGWPGSIVEFHKIIDPLVNPTQYGGSADQAFHFVAPSLPGYGFSGKPAATGWGVDQIGVAWGELMARLGYERYVAQGGDWGAMVTQAIGQSQTKHCAAIHVTMPIVMPDPDTMNDLSPVEEQALASLNYYNEWDSGYSKQQGTRPQTLGYCLADSPVGQAAWIVEKFWSWMDCGDETGKHPENILSKDELLDNVMMYWLTNAGASSGRLYWESFRHVNMDPIHMPVACSLFPKEIMRTSRRWAEQRFSNIIHWNEMDEGGHFAALEQPEALIEELRTCFCGFR